MPSPSSPGRDLIALSSDELTLAREMLSAGLGSKVRLPDLVFDDFSSYWLEIVETIHRFDGQGDGEVIAVIDSGIDPKSAPRLNVDLSACVDLTGEGVSDPVGHGTAIASFIHLIAPRARQVHVKLFDRSGLVPGASYEERAGRIAAAFKAIRDCGATLVNVSWNYLTTLDRHLPVDVRPGHFCRCPICSPITTFVKDADVDVFISEGNFKERPHGSWSCPAAATLAIPVLGFRDGDSPYSTNLDTTCAVAAPSRITLRESKAASITGSSYATPLVVATFAALRSALRERGFSAFSIPRSTDEGASSEGKSTSYAFPLDLLFHPPDSADTDMRDRHTEWTVPALNCAKAAEKRVAAGRPGDAGELCCLFADIMAVAYRRMGEWTLKVPIAGLILSLYAQGIHALLRSEIAIKADDYLDNADEVVKVMTARGQSAPDLQAALKQFRQYYSEHLVEFMFRASGP